MKTALILFLFFTNFAFGAGVVTHRFMSKKALDYMRETDLRDMLRRNMGNFMANTMLPDMGYILHHQNLPGGWLGEDTHWTEFENWFYQYIKNRCKSKGFPPKGSPECEYLWTMFFGMLSHGFADIQWHGGYIFRFSAMEFGASLINGKEYQKAHDIADNMGDLPAVFLFNERNLYGSFNLNWSGAVLESFADYKKRPRMRKNDLFISWGLQEGWYTLVKTTGLFPYLYFKTKFKWANDNYYGTLGGVDNTARRIAEVFDLIWQETKKWKMEKSPELSNRPYNPPPTGPYNPPPGGLSVVKSLNVVGGGHGGGDSGGINYDQNYGNPHKSLPDKVEWDVDYKARDGLWPFSVLKLIRADRSGTLIRSFHDPRYQLSPRGEYNCRYGLYLGGWRWFTFGELQKCPFKATADYQKAQCDRARYWPLSCRIY